MVQFSDGAIKAQLGCPDMKVPIAYALSYPDRMPSQINGKLRIEDYAHLTFERPDLERFPNLRLAFEALAAGGDRTCVLNAANEGTIREQLLTMRDALQMAQDAGDHQFDEEYADKFRRYFDLAYDKYKLLK